MMFHLTVGEKVKNMNIRPWVGVSRHQGWASLGFGSGARDELEMSPGGGAEEGSLWGVEG